MTRWLTVVGVGDDGLEGLAPAARALVEQAAVVVGGRRHLSMLPPHGEREIIQWPKPFETMLDRLVEHQHRDVCVLASGDPCCYGVGSLLAERLGAEAIRIIPAPSAFSLACARLGWRLSEVDTLTVHGRPLAMISSYLQPGAKLVVLSENGATPASIARLLCERGYGRSRLTVLSHMGGAKESAVTACADDWDFESAPADLNTVAIECHASATTPLLPRCPGLPDSAFRHDGQMTKQEVRAITLSSLAPVSGQTLWDVGAGCGSVAVEWMRAAARARAYAIERNPSRIELIAHNALVLGTPTIEIVPGSAPEALSGLPAPDAVFVGGGVTAPELMGACWQALNPGGRLVANAVTIEGERALGDWHETIGGRLVRIGIERAKPVGRLHGWKSMMTVTQLAATKNTTNADAPLCGAWQEASR